MQYMSPQLTAEFEYLTTRLEGMIEKVSNLPTDAQESPVGKSFSPVQAIEHMYVTEKSYTDYAKKTDQAKLKGRKGKPNFIYNFVLKGMNRPVGSNLPTPGMFQPKDGLSLEESSQKWRDERASLKEYLKKFNDNDACLKNPLMGWFSPRDLYVLMERHQDYHDARLPN